MVYNEITWQASWNPIFYSKHSLVFGEDLSQISLLFKLTTEICNKTFDYF
jgi:hypothetical protein